MVNWNLFWDRMGKIAIVITIGVGLITIGLKLMGLKYPILVSIIIAVVLVIVLLAVWRKAIEKYREFKESSRFKLTAFLLLLFSIVAVVVIVAVVFIHHGESTEFDITLDELPQRFQNDSIFVISEGREMQDLLGLIDMYWAWGISRFNRPEHSLNLYPKDDSNNLIYLISMEDKEKLKDTLDKIGIWYKYEKYDLDKKNISSFAYFSKLDNKNCLWIIEKESGGLNVATLYLSNPASWSFHNDDSFLFFSWQDSNEDGLIQIHEIIVEPKKNQMIKFWPEPRKEENLLIQEFRESSTISLGISCDKLDLVSAATITWSLGYFLSNSEKPKVTVNGIGEMEVKNVIIIGGPDVNKNSKPILDRLGIEAVLKYGELYRIRVVPGTTEISVKNLKVEDLCVIIFEKMTEGNRILIAGIGEYGTLAGSIFLSEMENWKHLDHHNVLILKWQDENSDSIVQLKEIALRYELDVNTSQNKVV